MNCFFQQDASMYFFCKSEKKIITIHALNEGHIDCLPELVIKPF